MLSLLESLPGGRFTQNVVVLAGGTVAGQAVVIAASPILTRLYTPEDFGMLGVYVSLLGLVSVIASLRYEFAIPLPEKDADAAAIVILSLAILPVTVTVVGLVILLFRDPIIAWTNTPGIGPYLWLLPVGMVLMGIYQVFNYWVVRKKVFSRIARTRFYQGIAAVITQLALYPCGPLGLLLGQVLGSAAGSGTLASLAVRHDRHAFQQVNRNALVRMALRYRRFPQVSTLSGIANSGGNVLPVLLLAAFFGPFVAGQFALVHRVVTWPMNVLGLAVSQVYFGEGVSALRRSPSNLRSLFLGGSKQLGTVAVLPMLALLLAGPWIFTFLFGSNWESAGQFARVLAPMMAVQLVAASLSQTLNILEHQVWLFAWDAVRLLFTVVSIAGSALFGSSPIMTVAIYSVAMLLVYVVLYGLQIIGIARSLRQT
ncbi:MAG: oligosaccharide flippase family protein [Pirellulales bacterium]|nr:oligosaccharide flippase family protein [Pirellulales bacterium]